MAARSRILPCLLPLWLCLAFVRPAQAEETIELVGNIYCRASADAGERPWGGVRVFVKGRPGFFSDTDPEHGRYQLTLPVGEVLDRKLTLVYAQSNLLLSEQEHEITGDDTVILAGQPTAQLAPKLFVVPYCSELKPPNLREMVRSIVAQISHRAALVHGELMRAHRFGSPETVNCLDDVLSRMGAHLRHAESRVPYFIDALGDDAVRMRREVTAIKIADERASELVREADYCLVRHALHLGEDSSRYIPDTSISPAGLLAVGGNDGGQFVPWNRPRPGQAVATQNEHAVWVHGASFETGVDSNFLQRQGSRVVNGWQFRPSSYVAYKYFDPLRLAATPNTESIEPSFEINLGLLGLLLTATEDGNDGLSKSSDLGVSTNVLARFEGQSALSASLFGQYLRRVEPLNEPEYQSTFGQNDLRAGGEATVNLGAGGFSMGAGYTLGVSLHDSATQSGYNWLSHRFVVSERLRFLPETALVHESEFKLRNFVDANVSLRDSSQLRSRLGLVGMLGRRLGVQVLLGWGQSDYESGNASVREFDGLLALGKLEWFFGPVAQPVYGRDALARPSLGLVYERDYRDSIVTDYYQRDRGSLKLTLTDGTQFLWLLQGGVSRVAYPSFVDVASASHPVAPGNVIGDDAEYRIDAGVALEYRLLGGLRLTGRFEFNKNLSDVVPILSDGSPTLTSLGFERYQVLGGVLYSR